MIQLYPAFVVLRIKPDSPTVVPWSESVKLIPKRSSVVPLNCKLQVMPPSEVLIIVPESPTAVPFIESEKEIPFKYLDIPTF